MEYQSIFDPTVDIKSYNGGWLINDVEYLTEEITDDDVQKMEMALKGIIEENAVTQPMEDIPDVLLRRTIRFHVVKKAVLPSVNGDMTFFECDCREYYFHRWCFDFRSERNGETKLQP
jgi:hypothetical protein